MHKTKSKTEHRYYFGSKAVYFLEVSASNKSDWIFSWFLPLPTGKCGKNSLPEKSITTSLPIPSN